jgi:ABC-2 type transport system permease protein
MRKTWTIAWREYKAMVGTKAFMVSITLMPILMFGGVFFATRLQNVGGPTSKTLIIADGSGGELFSDLQLAAEAHNKPVAAPDAASGSQGPSYILKRYSFDALSDDDRLKLSDQVRNDEITAFVEIPAGIVSSGNSNSPPVAFRAPNAFMSAERGWLERAITDAVTTRRLKALALDPSVVRRATATVVVAPLGLSRPSSDGQTAGASPAPAMASFFLPFGFMMLLFMVLMLSAQPLLESVMEEKNGRIAELLLGSVSSFQLMLGKLLGNVAGSLSVVAIYAAGGFALAAYNGWINLIPLNIIPWFVVFQVLAVLLFGSLFMAVGAAVTTPKEAQSMLLPVWLLLCVPMFVWLQIVREPNGPIAMWLSFFPPSAPMVNVLRLASDAVIPVWQLAVSTLLLLASALCVTYFAGRAFRVGMLWQGKTPQIKELLRWGLRG